MHNIELFDRAEVPERPEVHEECDKGGNRPKRERKKPELAEVKRRESRYQPRDRYGDYEAISDGNVLEVRHGPCQLQRNLSTILRFFIGFAHACSTGMLWAP